MNLLKTGASTSPSEVTNIELQGFWIWTENREYFVPFSDYPAFINATIAQIHHVQTLGPGQLYWPDLDVDIELEALEHPERFPLQFRP
jgi:hypothetical protein